MIARWMEVWDALPLEVRVLAKASLPLAAAWIADATLRDHNPRWRIWSWRAAAASALFLVMTALAPWRVRVPFGSAESFPASYAHEATPGGEPGSVWKEIAIAKTRDAALNERKSAWSPVDSEPGDVMGAIASLRGRPMVALWGVWGAVTALLTMGWLRECLRAKAFVRTSMPPYGRTLDALGRLHSREGGAPEAAIRVSDAISTPLLCGALQPVILLPRHLAETAPAEEIEAVLAHELAHVRSRDLLWHGVIQALTALIWVHPLVWGARRAHARACESACDAQAAGLVGDSNLYARALAGAAMRAAGKTPVGAALPMARSSDIRERLESLRAGVAAPPLGTARIATLACGVALAAGALSCVTLTEGRLEEATSARSKSEASRAPAQDRVGTGAPNSPASTSLSEKAPATPAALKREQRARNYVEKADGTNIEMIWIPAGTFRMGSDFTPEAIQEITGSGSWNMASEGPAHDVRLDGYWIAKTEVTVGQFRKFVEATGYKTFAEKTGWVRGRYFSDPWDTGSSWRKTPFPQDDDHPVVCLSRGDRTAFLEWLTEMSGLDYDLPTEAQWEYACRAGGEGVWPFGDDLARLGDFAWYGENSPGGTRKVATRQPNSWGLHDMLGNAREDCSDFYGGGRFPVEAQSNPLGPPMGAGGEGTLVTRGGCFEDRPSMARTTERNVAVYGEAGMFLGFRVCRPAYASAEQRIAWRTDRARKSALAKAAADASVASAKNSPSCKLAIGSSAPDFEIRDARGGVSRLSDRRGRVVLLHFWTPFSVAAIDQLPALCRLHQRFDGDKFEMVGVALRGSPVAKQATIDRFAGMKWPQIFSAEFKPSTGQRISIQDLYGVRSYPCAILIDRKGVIRSINDSEAGFTRSIVELLSEE